MQEVKINCQGAGHLRLDELVPFQKELKRLGCKNFDRLQKSLVQYGFCFPFFVWEQDEVHYTIDGHQRDEVLRAMAARPQSFKLPETFPVVFVEAKNRREAAELILLQSSHYGTITELGFEAFVGEYDLNLAQLEPLNLSHLDFKIKPSFVTQAGQDAPFAVGGEEPEELGKTYHPQYAVAVICESEAEQQAVFESLQNQGFTNLKVLAI